MPLWTRPRIHLEPLPVTSSLWDLLGPFLPLRLRRENTGPRRHRVKGPGRRSRERPLGPARPQLRGHNWPHIRAPWDLLKPQTPSLRFSGCQSGFQQLPVTLALTQLAWLMWTRNVDSPEASASALVRLAHAANSSSGRRPVPPPAVPPCRWPAGWSLGMPGALATPLKDAVNTTGPTHFPPERELHSSLCGRPASDPHPAVQTRLAGLE